MINKPQERRRRSPGERAVEIAMAAETLAVDDGLAALTLRGIGARAGVASSLVAHYEPSMDTVVARTFRALALREIAEVTELVALAVGPLARLRALVDAVSDPRRDDVAALWSDAWSIGRRNPELAAAARDCMRDWQSLATDLVRHGLDDGTFRDADPDEVGLLLFALVDATNAYALVEYRSDAERDRLIRRAVERAVAAPPGSLGPSSTPGPAGRPDPGPAGRPDPDPAGRPVRTSASP